MNSLAARARHLHLAFAAVLVLGAVWVASGAPTAEAGVYFNDTQYTYKEYWADHASFTGGCGADATSGGTWYIEPADCTKSIDLDIPDDVSGAIAAVAYVDLWRNRVSKTARFTINNGPQYVPSVGSNFSRTPFTATVPLTQLQTGTNVFRFQESTGAYHVHDVMIRVYYDSTNPIVAGPGSDVTPPSGQLTSVSVPGGPSIDPATGGTLSVDGNQVTLTATATDAKYVEFHAYYDGFDEDNDGVTQDWHNFLRNNYGPGGVEEKPNGATIGHVSTDSTAPYQVTWNLPDVASQSGVRFKIRVVDQNGNVVEAPGGASAEFTLQRSYSVETFSIPNFQDQALYFNNTFPQLATDTIDLPTDLNGADRVLLLGNYWNSPDISINGAPPFPAFSGNADTWDTSMVDLDPAQIHAGSNTIAWTYHPPGFGAMVEGPGPMIVIHRSLPDGAPVITRAPADAYTTPGLAATFSVAASGASNLVFQWLRDGQPIVGANAATYTTPALQAADNGAKYSVRVSNSIDTTTSLEATVYVATVPDANAPWWDTGFDFRVPLSVAPDAVERTDKIVSQQLNFSSLMTSAGAGGPSFDPNSIRVVEVDAAGTVIDASVPYQFDPGNAYNASSNAVGSLVWQLEGTTPAGVSRAYFVYFDKTSKGHVAPNFTPQVTRTVTTDEGLVAYRFDLADGSQWFFHTDDGGGFSSIVDRDGNDWVGWNTATGTAGDYRGFPNGSKPPTPYFHPGRPGTTVTTLLDEGPLRITFETRATDNSWIAVWQMYPTYSELEMNRAATNYWVMYEGAPGGTLDANDFVRRSDGLQVASDGTFNSDIAGDEWMYAADPGQNRSFFMAHGQDDGSPESYRQLDDQMMVLGFGRGGVNLNFPYLAKLVDGKPQTFAAGLVDSVADGPTGDHIAASSEMPGIVVGSSAFNGSSGGPNGGPVSDSFNGATLDPMWSFVDPVGDTTLSLTGTSVQLDIPSGPNHDLWAGRNEAPRILQSVANADLDVAVGFESDPTEASQGQGLLFQQDDDNWVRIAVVRVPNATRVDVYEMVDGVATRIYKKKLPGVPVRHLRAIRSGDNWQFKRSWNGQQWYNTGSFTIPLELQQVGIYATTYASSGGAPGFTSTAAYFENKASGVPVDQGPAISDVNVDATSRGAVVTWTTDTPSTTRLDHGPTVELGETTSDDTLTTAHTVELGFLACDVPYFVQPQSADDEGTTIGQIVNFSTDVCSPIVSDDFSGGSLGSHWSLFDPVGDASMSLTGTNALISLPEGSDHNLFAQQNRAVRLRQEGPAGNFGVEAKFESALTRRFQMEGVVVEEDDDSFLRFEIHHDGTNTKAYVASVLDGVATVYAYVNVPTSIEHYIRVTRAGDTWTMWTSTDALTWDPVASMDVDIESAYVGPYIGSTSTGSASPPAFIGSIDYFFNLDNPIDPEDGGAGPDTQPPVLSDVSATAGVPATGRATVSWTTDEPATTRVDWGATNAYEQTPVIDNVAVMTHSAVIGPLSCGTTYHFRAQSNDASGNVGLSPDMTVATPTCPAGAFSDNFDSPTLDSRWFVEDPHGSGTITPVGGMVSMSIPGGQRHDLTPTSNGAYRLLQPVADTDFQAQVGFESVVGFASQVQGVVFEKSIDTLVRFDLYSDGTNTRAFVGYLNPSNLQTLANVVVPGAVPGTLRVTRTGSTWTFEYSSDDGATWQTVYTGTIGLAISRMGPYVGNANPQLADVPAHTAFVDYFWSAGDPITITDPGLTAGPMFTIFGGNGLAWNGQPLSFGSPGLAQPDVNVLGRVLDPDGVTSITYRLNGGAPVTMGLGSTDCDVGISCTRRLAANGDFNADIDSALLQPGANTVTIRAIDAAFNVSTIDVPIDYHPGNQWPIPYSVGWDSVGDIYQDAQPIDGRWVVEGDSVRTNEIGYDRLLAVGDGAWGSFEAEVPVTIHSFDPAGYAFPSGGPGVGFIAHWKGHTQEGTTQPKYGFRNRLGALAWYRYRNDANAERFEIRDSEASLAAEDLSGRKLSIGVPYIFKLQAQTGDATHGPTYRLKVWEAGTAEPFSWDLESTLPVGSPDQGSLALVAHHVDATFGDVTVRDLSAVPPLVSPASGTYSGLTQVDMAGASGGEIRYTLDGSEPTSSSTLFTGPFLISETTTVKAKTFRTGFDPSPTTVRDYVIEAAQYDRVQDGLLAEYDFDEGSGTDIHNSAPNGSALDLEVFGGSDVTWLGSEQAIRLNGPSLIRTPLGAKPLNNAIRNSGSFTVEMWVDPDDLSPGQRTLLHLAPGSTGKQNLALSQNGSSLDAALRTSSTNSLGTPTQTAGGAVSDGLHQIVYVRRPNGAVEVFVDGSETWSGTRAGSLSAWGSGFALGIGSDIWRDSPWTGDIYLVAVYADDLTSLEVAQNFQAGVLPATGNMPPVVDAGADISVTEGTPVTMAASATDDGQPVPPGALTTSWSQVSGPGPAVFADDTSPTTEVTFPSVGTYVLAWSATDGDRTTVDQMQVEILADSGEAPPPDISPASGTYPGSVDVTISSTLPGADIRYTVDGTDPTPTSSQYSDSFTLTSDATVKARVYASGLDPSTVSSADYVIGAAARVTDGIVGFYPFNGTDPGVVLDESTTGAPLNLSIADPDHTARVTSGLRIDQNTVISSDVATKITDAVKATNALTTEVWIDPASASQLDAMIVSLGVNRNARNTAIIQEGSVLDAYLRTKVTDYSGAPPLSATGQVLTGPSQVVYTRDSNGDTALYVNGAVVATGAVAGTLANWAAWARLRLGGERDGTRPWLGTYYLLAVYDRALTSDEVLQNFVVGDV